MTAFTVAHSLTLSLAVLGLVGMPAAVVEPIIALSIVAVGIENLAAASGLALEAHVRVRPRSRPWLRRSAAGAWYRCGRHRYRGATAWFNAGVEAGQLAVAILVRMPSGI